MDVGVWDNDLFSSTIAPLYLANGTFVFKSSVKANLRELRRYGVNAKSGFLIEE
jgi:hypothetical protein